MPEQNFTVYPGKWPCKTCQEVVTSLRYWRETGDDMDVYAKTYFKSQPTASNKEGL